MTMVEYTEKDGRTHYVIWSGDWKGVQIRGDDGEFYPVKLSDRPLPKQLAA